MKKAYRIDIDGTLFETEAEYIEEEHSFHYHVKSVNHDVIVKVNKLFEKGHPVIIETGRHWNQLQNTKKQLDYHGVKYTTIIMGKVPGNLIDDCAFKPEEFLNIEI